MTIRDIMKKENKLLTFQLPKFQLLKYKLAQKVNKKQRIQCKSVIQN